MVTGLCGLLSVATQVDPEQLYDMIIKLRADAESDALVPDSSDPDISQLCLADYAGYGACIREKGHKGSHKDANNHQWRATRTPAQVVTDSDPASA
jgi:hypothetical protein